MMEKSKGKDKALYHSRGCFSCYTELPRTLSVREWSKIQQHRNKKLKKRTAFEDFLSTTTCEMDNGAVQSRGSMSSIGTSNQKVDPNKRTSGNCHPDDFVNHGLLLWNQMRQQWIGKNGSRAKPQVREPQISWKATYESLLGANRSFRKPIPLYEMVDFLDDVWEQEGLYD